LEIPHIKRLTFGVRSLSNGDKEQARHHT